MSMIQKKISESLEELVQACERFKECGKCNSDDCPMHTWCLEEETLSDIAYNTSKSEIEEFIAKAEKLTIEITKEDLEADYWNLRRCDPDYE